MPYTAGPLMCLAPVTARQTIPSPGHVAWLVTVTHDQADNTTVCVCFFRPDLVTMLPFQEEVLAMQTGGGTC